MPRSNSALGLALQVVALAALPQVLALAVAPITMDLWDGPEVGLALVPVVTVLLLFACGRAFVRGDHPVPLVAAYLVVSIVLAVASVEIVGRDEPRAITGIVADALAGPVAILAGVLLFGRRRAEPSPRAEAGAIVLVSGATSVIALGFQIAGQVQGDVHATPGAWAYLALTWVMYLAVAGLAIRAGRALLGGSDRARRALQVYVVASVVVSLLHTLVAVSSSLVDRLPLHVALPIQLIGLVGIAAPLVIWHHANRDLAPAPARTGAPPLAWLAWWFVPQLAVHAIAVATEPGLGGPLPLVIAQAACLAAAAALALSRTRGARLAALAAAATSFVAIALLVRDTLAAKTFVMQVPWWVAVLPFTAALVLAWLGGPSRPVRLEPDLARPDERD